MRPPQFDEDLGFIRRMWIVERVGWTMLSLFLAAALLGAFGTGLFSEVKAGPPDGAYTATYGRFERMQAPVTVRVSLKPKAASAREVVVWISSEYLSAMTVNGVTPRPERVLLGAGRVLFVFPQDNGPHGAEVRFNVEADSPGTVAGELGVGEAAAVPIRQFFYP